jgi:hypothetical protein
MSNCNSITTIGFSLIVVYFTPFPYYLEADASKNSNFAYAGIGIGLQKSQKIFWISNGMIFTYFFLKKNIPIFVTYFIFSICSILYLQSIYNSIFLMKYFYQIREDKDNEPFYN